MMEVLFFLIGLIMMLYFLNNKLLMIFYQNLIFILFFFMLVMNLYIKFLNNWENFYGDYCLDKISFLLILLMFWILGLMYLSILVMSYVYYYILLSLIMMFSLFGLFMSIDMLSFYLFFEVSLIPIIMMILGWGGQPERLLSIFYLLMYTLFVSLPFLFLLLIMFNSLYSLNFFLFYIYKFIIMNNFYFYLMILLIFLVKLPIYFLHLWLPKAHVEAPIFGSMILAGILLKMGGYGLVRSFYIMMNMCLSYNMLILSISFIGSILISFICLSQVDLKMLIAYSSVVHMGLMLCGGLGLFYWGLLGVTLMMISHGLCSSGLFCLLNFSYKRLSSRSLLFNKGMILYYPKMSMWWFLFSVMNMASPPSLSLVSEVYLIMSIIKMNLILLWLLFILSMVSSIYSIYIYSSTQHGLFFVLNKYWGNSMDEFMLIILHGVPMNILFMVLWLFF